MALATYSDLQAAVAGWLTRDDLATQIKDFITIFEAAANRRLRTRRQEITTTLTPSGGVATLPSDFLTWRRLTWTGACPRELEFVHPTYLRTLHPSLLQGPPSLFTIEGSLITLGPSDDTALTLDYWQKIPALSDGAPTNWLLTEHPGLYLFGSLAEAFGFTKKLDSLAAWAQRRDVIFDEITLLDQKTRGPSAMRVMGPTP